MYDSNPGMKMIGLILLFFLLVGGSWAWQAMTASTSRRGSTCSSETTAASS